MLLGYNHNINYKDSVFHIQTEDSGVKNPHIITLLYREGVILCSKKTSYADILRIDNLEAVVEDLMKEQHKDMLRRLKGGEFDEKAFGAPQQAEAKPVEPKQESTTPSAPPPPPVAPVVDTSVATSGVDLLFQEAVQTTSTNATEPPKAAEAPTKKQDAVSLDDAILNFFGASK
ncbi:hypothetical protein SAMN02745119_01516 [Trichlorobacter thiogenes]|uniref:Uncharacterized protein n=1 Tax=Trichlorobacter thiogenes TaxID=115783 RepID=A0A1T4N480_9BACT|nr:hypothetical protein [Trichlorobacter thiogenes]SJZ74139.1 hypothetical protein SAMN02745119_01516 [Trichlorobacter thiogenes]